MKKKKDWAKVALGAAILAYGLGNDVSGVGIADDPITVPGGLLLIGKGLGIF